MCRLFGLHAGSRPTAATFWLLDAPDSLSEQSRREPDGAGIGVFDSHGAPVVDKRPLAAYQDSDFARDARDLRSTVFLAHVRYASTGGLTVANTHPFAQDGRLFAHNGAFAGLDLLDARLEQLHVNELVRGQTDSERMFALITAEIRDQDGDVERGLIDAVSWIARELPVYCLNLILATATDLWALRYPDTNGLYVLQRPAGGMGEPAPLDASSRRIHARSAELSAAPSVVVASEAMDNESGWRMLAPGELIHADAALTVTSTNPFPKQLGHPLDLAALSSKAASSQRPPTHEPQ